MDKEQFIDRLFKRVKSIDAESSFEGAERFAYQSGFQDSLGMMFIDLTGTPKSLGMYDQLVKETKIETLKDVNDWLVNHRKLSIKEIDKMLTDLTC